jgi:hypothetical protein
MPTNPDTLRDTCPHREQCGTAEECETKSARERIGLDPERGTLAHRASCLCVACVKARAERSRPTTIPSNVPSGITVPEAMRELETVLLERPPGIHRHRSAALRLAIELMRKLMVGYPDDPDVRGPSFPGAGS